MIKCDLTKYATRTILPTDKMKFRKKEKEIKSKFRSGELSYWGDVSSLINHEELNDIVQAADYIRNNCEVFLVIGIGGSYMGAKAIIEALSPTFNREGPEIIYLGTDLDADYYKDVIDYIVDKEVIVNVISKSGNTLEPSIAFDIIMYILEGKYSSEEIKNRVIITTDRKDGSLRRLVNQEGYFSLEIPRKIGGRFSVFTPVGLLPIAVAGIDILELLEGYIDGGEYIDLAVDYAVTREAMFGKKKYIESFTIYNPKLTYFTEWLKQLFAETQGKKGKGILPISNINTRDLHSMGQFLQEGNSIVFETVIGIEDAFTIKVTKYNKTLHEINKIALDKVCIAHEKGKTPSIVIKVEELNAHTLGEMVRFFMTAAIAGALLIDVDPFNQPGVEAYKNLIDSELNNKFMF